MVLSTNEGTRSDRGKGELEKAIARSETGLTTTTEIQAKCVKWSQYCGGRRNGNMEIQTRGEEIWLENSGTELRCQMLSRQ